MCKYFASEMVGRVADRAVQIHGGAGLHRGLRGRALLPRRAAVPDLRGHLADPAADHRPRDAARGGRLSAVTAPAAEAYDGLAHDRFRRVGEPVRLLGRERRPRGLRSAIAARR